VICIAGLPDRPQVDVRHRQADGSRELRGEGLIGGQMTVVRQLELEDVAGGRLAQRQEVPVVAHQHRALVLGAGQRHPRALVRRPGRIDLPPPRCQVGQVLLRQRTVPPLGRRLPVPRQDGQRPGALAADGAQQIEIRVRQLEVAGDALAHRPLGQQVGKEAMGDPILGRELAARQR
jgi:hypothetical protein